MERSDAEIEEYAQSVLETLSHRDTMLRRIEGWRRPHTLDGLRQVMRVFMYPYLMELRKLGEMEEWPKGSPATPALGRLMVGIYQLVNKEDIGEGNAALHKHMEVLLSANQALGKKGGEVPSVEQYVEAISFLLVDPEEPPCIESHDV